MGYKKGYFMKARITRLEGALIDILEWTDYHPDRILEVKIVKIKEIAEKALKK